MRRAAIVGPLRRRLPAAAAAYRSTPVPAARSPWTAARWCAVDLELSGLDPRRHEIVSYAAIPIEHGRVLLSGAVAGLVRPARELSESAIRVHGIRAADLADAPALPEALEPLLAAITGRALVVHVERIEREFLGRALRLQGLRLRSPVVDTSVLGRLWLSERDGRLPGELALEELARSLGLPSHAQHDALGDALTTAQVFIALASHLSAVRVQRVRDLERARRRLRAAVMYPTAPEEPGGSRSPR